MKYVWSNETIDMTDFTDFRLELPDVSGPIRASLPVFSPLDAAALGLIPAIDGPPAEDLGALPSPTLAGLGFKVPIVRVLE